VDEDELADELEQLEQEQLDNKMLNAGPTPVNSEVGKIPSVPTGPVKGKATKSKDEEEEEELRQLQLEMAQ
jgi:charged multivesicular body protein 4A/B